MEDVLVNTKATFIGWGDQTPLTGGAVTQLRGINVSVVACADDRVGVDAWEGDKWEGGRSKFICTAKTAGGGCDGDSGGMSALAEEAYSVITCSSRFWNTTSCLPTDRPVSSRAPAG